MTAHITKNPNPECRPKSFRRLYSDIRPSFLLDPIPNITWQGGNSTIGQRKTATPKGFQKENTTYLIPVHADQAMFFSSRELS